MKITSHEKLLVSAVESYMKLDAVVVEGYDGVGKGRVLSVLSEALGTVPYRPDYNLWQKHDHRLKDRWKVSGFFLDVFSHFKDNFLFNSPMLFDRGVISGAVYNNDITIAEDYKDMVKDISILHILVTCSREDYEKFSESRGSGDSLSYNDYVNYTHRYINCLEKSKADYILYQNFFNKDLFDELSNICRGCGHYSYGICRHPKINDKVDGESLRCEFSKEKEVQDEYIAEVHSV